MAEQSSENERPTKTLQNDNERFAPANGSFHGRPAGPNVNSSTYHLQAMGHGSSPGQYMSSFPQHSQNGFIHAGMPVHHPQGPPVIMMQGSPPQQMQPSAAGPPPQLYLQSGQPVYRNQIQPMYAATQGQPVYRPSPSPQLAPTPSRSQASQSPAQYQQHAASPHVSQHDQSRAQVMYSAVSPSAQHSHTAYRPHAQSSPVNHYAQHPNGSGSGPVSYAQMGMPRPAGQPVYAQQPVETQRFMHQPPTPDGFAYRVPAVLPQYAPSQPTHPSSR